MKPFLFTALIVILTSVSFCQGQLDSSKVRKLKDLGFYPFPTEEELKSCLFKDSLLRAEPLSEEDINESFSNTSDLSWLKEITEKNRVLLIGEEHYNKYIANLRNRILFYVNTVDYFPLLVLEAEYSRTGYVNYYINLDDDNDAQKFYKSALNHFVYSVEEFNLINDIRKWNKLNPAKKITVGFSDIEHNFIGTIDNVLLPYFSKIDPKITTDYKTFSREDLGIWLIRFNDLLKKAKEVNLTGDYPFLTVTYIGCVIKNLESLYNSYHYEPNDFDYYRQKAMIRNLTDTTYLGKFFISGKVLMHGGGYHMTTHYPYPENANFFREGSYLSEEFESTKDKVYSIMVHSLYLSLGNASRLNPDSCSFRKGTSYVSILSNLINAYKLGLITPDDNLIGDPINDFHKLILNISSHYQSNPIRIVSLNHEGLLKIAKENDKNDLLRALQYNKQDYERYDGHVFVPCSPLIESTKVQ